MSTMVYRYVVVVLLITHRSVGNTNTSWLEAKFRDPIEEVTAHLHCNNETLTALPLPSADWDRVTSVIFTGCSPAVLRGVVKNAQHHIIPRNAGSIYKISLYGIFGRVLGERGIIPYRLKKLEVNDVPESARFNETDFKGLESLEQLKIRATGSSCPEQLPVHILGPLSRTLTYLTVENEALPPLLPLEKIRTVVLIHGRSLGRWEILSRHLRFVVLRDWIISPDALMNKNRQEVGWLADLGVLHIKAEEMELQSLKSAMFGARELVHIELPNNGLTSEGLNDIFRYSSRVVASLDVSRNNLTDIQATLNSQSQLESLNLSSNNIHSLRRTLLSLHAVLTIRRLWMDNNPLDNFCDQRQDPVMADDVAPLRLQHVSLVGVGISRLCFSAWSSLHTLNITSNIIEELRFGQLPLIGNAFSLTVDLRNNPVVVIHLNEPEYYALKGARKAESGLVKVHTNALKPFDCNCHNAWLARALRERRVELSAGAHCLGGVPLSDVPPEQLECDPIPCAPCRCNQRWNPRIVVVYCEALGFREIPEQWPKLGELHLKDNLIDTLRVEDLPDTLTVLDVSYNNISRVDAAVAEKLFQVSERRVWFAGNPLDCDCDNWPLLGALQAHSVQVEDYENLICASGSSFTDVSKEILCGTSQDSWVWMGALGGTIVALVALMGSLYARYDQRIKVWLYAHGYCLRCVREEELDADREYDAFVSFAHGDHEFVADKLLPKLESDSCAYKVCVHYRDWTPGDLIPTQIVRSVASSRRTVIVLSNHFVQSVWGMLEFRTAHVSAIAEGRVRVLVIALQDSPPIDELPEELRLYLRSTTYLRWDDPWFWDKFRYALPHRTRREISCKPREMKRELDVIANHIQCIASD